jgi:cephalosporin hydroxylase
MISDEYHKWYESNRIWEKTKWLGVPMWKLPFDAFIIQELICMIMPDLIIETGTGCGGSSVFYASIMQLLNKGKIITVDVDGSKVNWYEVPTPIMDRIYPVVGNSVSREVIDLVEDLYNENEKTMVILDSWHSYDHVIHEMLLYKHYVSRGSYMIVEDTHVHGHPVEWEHGEGPYEAVQDFLKENDDFIVDHLCEKYEMTFNPSGYLRRIR